MTDHIYLDHNATTPMRPDVRAAVVPWLAQPLNPSSVHYHGQVAQRMVGAARATIKRATGCNEVIFTAGGTEANNLMLQLLLKDISKKHNQPCQLIYFMAEHPSIKNFAHAIGEVYHGKLPAAVGLPLNRDGQADVEALRDALKKMGDAPKLIALQLCNHETGVLQPMEKIVALANQHNGFVVADGVQFFAHGQCDIGVMGLTACTMAGHKLGGGHGAAAVMMMTLPDPSPLLHGGGQERGYRPGTQNTIAIHAMALALDSCQQEQESENKKYKIWRDKLEREAKKIRPNLLLAGAGAARLDHVALLVDETIAGQELVVAMDSLGVSVSAGAACSSGRMAPSDTLSAMGYNDQQAKNTLRVSFGHDNQDDDVEKFLRAYQQIIARY
ncbi:MAG: aminotransferase class V-fold PLP-dependent enzyme [Hydrotalea sp.]|nr:aminotransferase class V-fold PLP-dependent enzyme [Hydrotalea sp.]